MNKSRTSRLFGPFTVRSPTATTRSSEPGLNSSNRSRSSSKHPCISPITRVLLINAAFYSTFGLAEFIFRYFCNEPIPKRVNLSRPVGQPDILSQGATRRLGRCICTRGERPRCLWKSSLFRSLYIRVICLTP